MHRAKFQNREFSSIGAIVICEKNVSLKILFAGISNKIIPATRKSKRGNFRNSFLVQKSSVESPIYKFVHMYSSEWFVLSFSLPTIQ